MYEKKELLLDLELMQLVFKKHLNSNQRLQ